MPCTTPILASGDLALAGLAAQLAHRLDEQQDAERARDGSRRARRPIVIAGSAPPGAEPALRDEGAALALARRSRGPRGAGSPRW